jgi:hypothetical protein
LKSCEAQPGKFEPDLQECLKDCPLQTAADRLQWLIRHTNKILQTVGLGESIRFGPAMAEPGGAGKGVS